MFLVATTGTMLVSDQRIYQRVGGDKLATSLNLADIIQIQDDDSFFATTIAIKTRTNEIKAPNFFENFLAVVKPFFPSLALKKNCLPQSIRVSDRSGASEGPLTRRRASNRSFTAAVISA